MVYEHHANSFRDASRLFSTLQMQTTVPLLTLCAKCLTSAMDFSKINVSQRHGAKGLLGLLARVRAPMVLRI